MFNDQRGQYPENLMITMLIAGLLVGAGLMFILDPSMGRRRRAFARDQIIGRRARHYRNRAQGVMAEIRDRFQHEE